MRTRLVPFLLLAGLALSLPGSRGRGDTKASDSEPATPFKGAVVLRVKPLDELIADARYVTKLAGREEEVKQFEKLLKSKTGPKGLEGIDTKKPLGAYGILRAKLDESQGVVLLPIADETTFLKFLDTMDLKAEKDKGGLYTLTSDMIPFPILFRFANNYLYGTVKVNEKSADALDKAKLPLPSSVLAGPSGSVLSLTANLDQVPAQLRKMAISFMTLQLGNLKDEAPPNEPPAQKALREAILDNATEQVKSLLTDGKAVKLDLGLDRKKHDLAVSFRLGANEGSGLAKNIAALGMLESATAGLVRSDSAIGGYLHLALPAPLRKAFGPFVDEATQKALDQEQDKDKRELFKVLADALKPTARAGVIDQGIDVRGPGQGGKYTLVIGAAVKEGEAIEKALKKVLAKAPAEVKKAVKTDVARAGGVNVHEITPDKVDDQTRELFGDGPFYFAMSPTLLVLTAGEGAKDAVGGALSTRAKVARPFSLQLSLARMAKMMQRDQPHAPAVAKKVFQEKGSDRVRLTLNASQAALELKLSTRTEVIAFGSLLEKEGKKGGN
jgi:hypothetical protein